MTAISYVPAKLELPMSGRIVSLVFLALLLHTSPLTGGNMVLVDKGVSKAAIVIAGDAPEETARAADYLAEYIGKISSAKPAIVSSADAPASGAIWVGPNPLLASRFPGVSLSFEKPEEILIVCNGTDLAILGRDRVLGEAQIEHGSANAIYTFIQRYLGVRWLWPGALGEDFKPADTIAVPAGEYRFAPLFRQRAMNKYRIQYGAQEKEFIEWHRFQRNELHSLRMSAGHYFSNWGGKYFEQHPEFFAMAPDGKRGWSYKDGRLQVCVTNEGLHNKWLESTEELIASRPGHVLSATSVDGTRTGQCMCDNCKAWDHPNGETVDLVWGSESGEWSRMDYPSLTERYVKFWNVLAGKLKDRYPGQDLLVGGMAYGVYSAPPVETHVDDRVVIGYVGRMILASEADRTASHEAWKMWADKCTNMTIRPNLFWYTGGMIGMPSVSTRKTIEDYRFLAEHNCRGIVFDSWPGFFATQGPQLYLMMQLAWDPMQDGNALLSDYYTRAFGPAAQPVREYFELMETIHDEVSERVRFSSGSAARETPAIYAELYTDERMAQAAKLLETAKAAASGGPAIYGQRVAYIKTGLDFVNLNLASIRAMAEVRASEGRSQEAVQNAIRIHTQREEMLKNDTTGFALGGRRFNQTRTSRGMVDFLGPPAAKFLKAGGLDDE